MRKQAEYNFGGKIEEILQNICLKIKVVKNDGDLQFFKHYSILRLITEMRKSNNRFPSSDKFKATPKSAVSKASFESRMCQHFNLRNPWTNPEIWIDLRELFVFETPDDFTSQILQTFVHGLDLPVWPITDRSKRDIYNILTLFLGVIHSFEQF